MTEKRPNIIFYFTDQQRSDTCGCYGQPLPITPYLDQLASEGVCFENAFSPSLSAGRAVPSSRRASMPPTRDASATASPCPSR
ncbi:MAG: sulfatase-like hydrolase/transferase [Spirochaetaceae bacterium]|nr:sulfatase-like hydrolase/transferase [Spirochaetaceae bacterium]